MSSDNDSNPFAIGKISRTALDNLLSLPEGFTITLSGRTPDEGFCVGGLFTKALILSMSDDAVSARASIRDWLLEIGPTLREEGVHLGGWLDSETGLYWLDLVRVFSPAEREAALKAAWDVGELAVWSLHDGEEIRA
jgi:hypothetical protein